MKGLGTKRPRAPSTNPRILITTAYRHGSNDFYDMFGANIFSVPRFELLRTTNASVRFIKQNVPEIEVLDFPTWAEYVSKLKQGWDVVGFSFFHHDLEEILAMAAEARRQGVKELWSGGFGAFSPEAEGFADRIWIGYAEEELAEVFGRKLDRLRHPPMPWSVNLHLPLTVPYKKLGVLFTQRGCPYRCSFCQTPLHCPHPYRMPLESVEEVLRYYREVGINEVWITDETFYTFPSHSEKVIDMLAKYGFHWWVMTHLNKCIDKLEGWSERGLAVVAFGLESVHDDKLKEIGKHTSLDRIRQFRQRTLEHKIFTMASYIIGYEEDTTQSILADYQVLAEIGFDAYQLSVLTPMPRLAMSQRIASEYGIFEQDYHRWTARYLVWNHPHISPERMEFLFRVGIKALNRFGIYARGALRIIQRRIQQKGAGFLWDDIARPFLHALRYNERKQGFLSGSGSQLKD